MARKIRRSKKAGDFSQSREIINSKISIQFIEPEQIILEEPDDPPEDPSLDEVRDDIDQLIEDYSDIESLALALDAEVDRRAKDLTVSLDPSHDAFVIDSLERLSANKELTNEFDADTLNALSKKQIPYALYKKCMEEGSSSMLDRFKGVDPNEILKASADPFRDKFGGLALPPGLKRPELDTNVQSIEPVNLKDFKREMIIELFKLMTPMFTGLTIDIIKDINPF